MPGSPTAASSRCSARIATERCRTKGRGAEAAVGFHLDQEPRLSRPAVRGEPGSSADGEHHASRDDRRISGPRQPVTEAFTEADIEQASADLDRLGEVGIDYDDVVQALEDEGSTSSPRAGWSCSRTSRRHRPRLGKSRNPPHEPLFLSHPERMFGGMDLELLTQDQKERILVDTEADIARG